MKIRYRIRYVGNDSRNHRMYIWAENSREVKLEAKRRGAEFVMSVKPASYAWLWILIGIGVAILVVAVG